MNILLRVFVVLLLAAGPTCRGEESQVPPDAVRLIDFTKPFTTVEGDWKDKVRVENGQAVIESCGTKGAAGSTVTSDVFAHGDDCLAILVQVGPKNTAKTICVRMTDQDQHECVWTFQLPKTGSAFALVPATNGASLLLPNQPDPRDYSINDLRRITGISLLGNSEYASLVDVKVAAILAIKPDAAALAARESLTKDVKQREGWMKTRNALAAQYVAKFPEITVATPTSIPGKKIIRAYHIGNSLTFKALSGPRKDNNKEWSVSGDVERLVAFMDVRGIRYVPGWHIHWGASLPTIWNHRFEPALGSAGPAGKALVDYTWDVLTLQLWGSDVAGDVSASRNFIDLALTKNPELQVFMVETWVEKNDKLDPDFPTQWNRDWKPDQVWGIPPIHCAAYSQTVFQRLQKATADLRHPVRLIPVGTVLYELDKRMRAGAVPGFTRVEELYNDKVHLKETGNYVALETFYTVITGQNPTGQPRTDMFPTITDSFAAIVQETIWKVVTATPATGISSASKTNKE